MTIEYLKKATKTPVTGENDTRDRVAAMLQEIEAGGEAKARQYAEALDNWTGDIIVSRDAIDAAGAELSQQTSRSRPSLRRNWPAPRNLPLNCPQGSPPANA